MSLLKAGVCAWLSIGPLMLAQAPHVTDTKVVDNWEEKGHGKEVLRKINGRWWTQDNREVTPPGKGGFFWTVDSKPGSSQFFHHRPFELARAESLHLWMRREEVEAALGPPNRASGRDEHGRWFYYAANGVKVNIWFVDDGVLGDAKYETVGEKAQMVASVERDLNGQDLFKLLAERASQRSRERQAQRSSDMRNEQAARMQAFRERARSGSSGARYTTAQPSTVLVAPAAPESAAKKRIIPADAFAGITLGATRDDLLNKLGEPNNRFAISGDDGTRESFTYDLDSGETVVIRLLDGKVVKVR